MLRRLLLACPPAVFAVASLLLLWRSAQAHPSSHAIVNIESLAAVAFVAALTLRSRNREVPTPTSPLLPPLLLLIPLPFLLTLNVPLLFDTYAHVVKASAETLPRALEFFYVHPVSGDFFFRPLGYLDYWLESQWAGFYAPAWRLGGIALHLIAAAAIYRLARRLAVSSAAGIFAALLFGLHGSNPEVVSWTAARFDELSTCFSLAALIFLCRYVDHGKGYAPMLLACLCAMLSKEAALSLPLLAVCVLAYRGASRSRALHAVAGFAVTAAVTLAYRFWLLGGIGGYRDASGESTALQFNPLHFLELLLFRMWAVLLVPINSSIQNQWWLSLALIMALIAMGSALLYSAASRRKIIAAILFCWAALLPASHLALLDSSLLGSRVYHLSLVGLALFWAAVYDGFANRGLARMTAFALILFQITALTHNLLIWRDTALLAGKVCTTFPLQLNDNETVVVQRLPKSRNGVYFLSNAFDECLLVNSGKKINVLPSAPSPAKIFRWDDASQSIVQVQK